jgi:hypothetical protein
MIEERAAAVGCGVDAQGWLAEFETGFATIAGRFGRVEPRRQARSFLLGLLSEVDSRSCWQLAEQAGDGSPHAMQREGCQFEIRGCCAGCALAADYPSVGVRAVGVSKWESRVPVEDSQPAHLRARD